MQYRIYKDDIGYFIKCKDFLGIWRIHQTKFSGIGSIKYFSKVDDAEKEIEKLKIKHNPELIKEL